MIERFLPLAIVPANLLSTMANFNLDVRVYAGSEPYPIALLGQEQDLTTFLLVNSYELLNRMRDIHLDNNVVHISRKCSRGYHETSINATSVSILVYIRGSSTHVLCPPS